MASIRSARSRLAVVALVVSLTLIGGCGFTGSAEPWSTTSPGLDAPGPTPSLVAEPTLNASPPGRVDKLLVIVEENRSVADVTQNMPFLAAQGRRFGTADQYYAITHPSLPNYIVMAGGSNLGVTDDEDPDRHVLRGSSVFGQALAGGHTTKTYAEAMASNCQLRNQGTYAVRHNPWTYFADPAERRACRQFNLPAGTTKDGALLDDIHAGQLPTFGLLIPDVCHDGHDCSAAVADRWLQNWLPIIESGADFRSGRLAVIVTWDEDDDQSGNHIFLTMINPAVQSRRVRSRLDHYALSATISSLVGARPLRDARGATDLIAEFGLASRRPMRDRTSGVARRRKAVGPISRQGVTPPNASIGDRQSPVSVARSSSPGRRAVVRARRSLSRPVALFPIGLRSRLTLLAVAVVLAAMIAGGGGLILLLADNVETTATSTASARAGAVNDIIASIGLTEAAASVGADPGNGQLVQIITPDGLIFSASDPRIADRPMARLRPGAGQELITEARDLLGDPGEWAVVARGVAARGSTYVVQVASPLSASREVIREAVRYLLLGTPLLLLGTGIAAWFLLGRILRAVERIRREVSEIDSQNLSTRVDVPRTRDEINRLAETMNHMLERLERYDLAQRAFVSDASHELRSPLASLMAAAELAHNAEGARRDQLMQTVLTESSRLRQLVENLMLLARSDGAPGIELEEVDLDDVLDQQRRRLQATSPLHVSTSISPVKVTGDARSIERALRNLVDNSARHAVSTVRLSLRRDGDTAVLWIDNDGPAIPEPDRIRIFQRFVRLDESRSRDAGGSGLGLAIVQTVIEQHHGDVGVVDAPDGWCRFEVRLSAPILLTEHPDPEVDPGLE